MWMRVLSARVCSPTSLMRGAGLTLALTAGIASAAGCALDGNHAAEVSPDRSIVSAADEPSVEAAETGLREPDGGSGAGHAGSGAEAAADSASVAARPVPFAERPEPPEGATLLRDWFDVLLHEPGFGRPRVHTLRHRQHFSELVHLDRGTSLIFRVNQGGRTTAVFKPEQRLGLSDFRGEIASFRLCAAIECGLIIPEQDEVRISEADFLGATGLSTAEGAALHYGRDRTSLVWAGGSGGPWLYGVRKAWVPGFCTIPIEDHTRWVDLVQAGSTVERLRNVRMLDRFADLETGDPERWERLAPHLQGVDGAEFVEQLSNLHVFDVLTNNWDRYRLDNPGANTHFRDGVFVSIDHGATFPTSEADRGMGEVTLRIQRIEVFSRRTIERVRAFDVEHLGPILFAESPRSHRDDERLQYLEQRRRWLLAYVDGLIAQHGEDAVLIFE